VWLHELMQVLRKLFGHQFQTVGELMGFTIICKLSQLIHYLFCALYHNCYYSGLKKGYNQFFHLMPYKHFAETKLAAAIPELFVYCHDCSFRVSWSLNFASRTWWSIIIDNSFFSNRSCQLTNLCKPS